MATKYILVDKVYLEHIKSYQLDLYDTIQGVIKRVIVPVTEMINLTALEDLEDALQPVK